MFGNLSSISSSLVNARRLRASRDANTLSYRPALTILAATCAVFGATAAAQTNPATTVSVDANSVRQAINPNIYGAAFFSTSADVKQFNLSTNRIGGNNESTYNWNIQLDEPAGVSLPTGDAMNLDNDWYFESYLESTTPGGNNDSIISASNGAGIGTQTIVTIPMLPYIATVASNANTGSASLWSFSIKKYHPQVADPCGNGAQKQGGGRPLSVRCGPRDHVCDRTRQQWELHLQLRE